MKRLNLHCISPQHDSLSDISHRIERMKSNSDKVITFKHFTRTKDNIFGTLKEEQFGWFRNDTYYSGSCYKESIHIENGDWWFSTNYNYPHSMGLLSKNSDFDEKPMTITYMSNINKLNFFAPEEIKISELYY